MKAKLIKLGALLLLTGIFVWSHSYYSSKAKETHDAIVVMEYKVLDKQIWSLEEAAKDHALSQDSSYEKINVLKKQHQDAQRKKKIGFWLMILLGIATSVYSLYVVYAFIVFLVKEEGYAQIREKLSAMKQKM